MSILKGKKAVIIGDRDGIPGQAIAECAMSAGADVVFASTECFVWTSAGAMDLENQKRVKEFANQYGSENLVVLVGAAEGEAAGLAAETVMLGDPTFAGPLTGVQLGLDVYHVCEPEVKEEIDPDIYEEQISMMEMVLDVDDIVSEMNAIREQYREVAGAAKPKAKAKTAAKPKAKAAAKPKAKAAAKPKAKTKK